MSDSLQPHGLASLAHQAPLSMDFSWQEHWSRMLVAPPEDLPDPGIKAVSPALAGGFFTNSTTWEALPSSMQV